MSIDEAIERFEKRSATLARQAYLFLVAVALLLVAAAAAVLLASNITAGDIGSPSLDEKAAMIKREQDRTKGELDQIKKIEKACADAAAGALRRWSTVIPTTDVATGVFVDDPPGPSMVDAIVSATDRFPNANSFRMTSSLSFCGDAQFVIYFTRAQLDELKPALAGKSLLQSSDIEKLNRRGALVQRLRALDAIHDQTNLQKLEIEVGLLKQTNAPAKTENDLYLRLVQTSVTRFGLLAVVGFFVSILVSLYRYNVRLAAFYAARADLLRLMGPTMTVSDFGLMAVALTPTLEFGKSPQPPIGQLTELMKVPKEGGK